MPRPWTPSQSNQNYNLDQASEEKEKKNEGSDTSSFLTLCNSPSFPPPSITHCSLNYLVTQINPFFSVQWLDNKSQIYCNKWKIKNKLAKNKQKTAYMAIFCVNQNLEDRLEDQYLTTRWKEVKLPLRVGEEGEFWRKKDLRARFIKSGQWQHFIQTSGGLWGRPPLFKEWQCFLCTHQSSTWLSHLGKEAICQYSPNNLHHST